MNRSKLLRLAAVGAAAAMVLTACGDDNGTDDPTDGSTDAGSDIQRIVDAGRMVVGVKFDQPTFGLDTPDGVVGFDVEIANLIAAALGDGIEVEFVEAVSANREPFIQNGTVDIVVATYTINDTRDEVIDFAGPYYVAGQDIMVPAGNPDNITGIESVDTADLTGCSVDGSTSIENLTTMAPNADTITFDTYSKCADEMALGGADYVTTDNVILVGLIADSDGAYELVNNPFTTEPYGIGVPEGSDLRCQINEILADIYASGEWAAAYDATVGQVSGGAAPAPPELNNEGC